MHIYNIMFGGMPARPTGLAMSVIRRARALVRAGHTYELLIDAYAADFDANYALLREEGALENGRISIRNMYQELGGMSPLETLPVYHCPLGETTEGWTYLQDPRDPDIWRGSHNGEYKHFVWMRGAQVNGIDTLVSGKRVTRTWYDSAGLPCKVEHMDTGNRPYLIEYKNRAGATYMQEAYASTGVLSNIALHRSNGIVNFPSRNLLVDYWLREVVFKNTKRPAIISEYGFYRHTLGALEKQIGASVIYTFHNNHRTAPYSAGAPLRREQEDFFSSIQTYKAVVLLTEEQKADIQQEFGPLDNLHVIPHHIPAIGAALPPRDPHRVAMVARFHRIKGQAEVIHAFVKVVAQFPSATLHLFGRGPEESSLRALIKAQGLEGSVHVRGFTADAFTEFAEASVSVVASKYEGFCLSLAESMAVGCVPVAYRFKYGPADLITDRQDGVLVDQGDVDGMADAIASLLGDRARRERMSLRAQKIMERLTEENLVAAWERLLLLDD